MTDSYFTVTPILVEDVEVGMEFWAPNDFNWFKVYRKTVGEESVVFHRPDTSIADFELGDTVLVKVAP